MPARDAHHSSRRFTFIADLAFSTVFKSAVCARVKYNSIILHPDRITLFRLPIASLCRTEIELKAQIRKTLIHELGHYFGFSEGDLEARGWA
ncbi:MAG: hypothetical protein FJ030_14100 [Chloroflexi bacterium]|nr:hypothetical protein [Chloroflexota bacterium]